MKIAVTPTVADTKVLYSDAASSGVIAGGYLHYDAGVCRMRIKNSNDTEVWSGAVSGGGYAAVQNVAYARPKVQAINHNRR